MLKRIFLDCNRNKIEEKEIKEFCEKMRVEGIEVTRCRGDGLWDEMQADSGDGEGSVPDEKQVRGGLMITDRVKTALPEGVYPVGYGMDYAGSLPYIITSLAGATARYLRLIYARYRKEPAVIARTERLVVREMELSDLDALYALYDTLSDCPFVEPLYEREKETAFTENYIRNMYGFYQYGLWLVFEAHSGVLIGRIGIENREIDGNYCQELGYLIGRPWQRRGYAQEAGLAVIQYAFEELELEKLYLCTGKNNKPSIALAHKLGFLLYAQDVDGMNIYYKPNA